ncbi:MAG TPA: NAD(P)/FAD-dependent oxidoreductase [Candidatus Eremiobacteraceae bacterium]
MPLRTVIEVGSRSVSKDRVFEAIVIGGGSGGLAAATALKQGGMRRVAVVERERVGGECAFWACVPSKVLLRAEQPVTDGKRVPGSKPLSDERPDFAQAAAWRTTMVDQYSDAIHASELAKAHVDLLRGTARIESAGIVSVDGERYRAKHIVIATGSTDAIPDIQGLNDCPYWLSRDATAADAVPERLVVLGGGPVGVELGQMFARFGAEVVLIESSSHIIHNESAGIAEILTQLLKNDGVTISTGAKAVSVACDESSVSVHLDNGKTISASKLLVATGRKARTVDLGLELVGITVDDGGNIPIDDSCRAAADVYAVGDVTGKAMFTHTAKYQSRIAVAAILGHPEKSSYDAVPRCIFTDPEVASVGKTQEQAREAGIDAIYARVNFDEITRPALYFEDIAKGAVELIADKTTRRLIGGWIVGPMASEMTGFISLAIQSGAEFDTLLSIIQPYPTFSEAFFVAVDRLATQVKYG